MPPNLWSDEELALSGRRLARFLATFSSPVRVLSYLSERQSYLFRVKGQTTLRWDDPVLERYWALERIPSKLAA